MGTLLRVDCSPIEASVSRDLTEEFVQRWSALHPSGWIIVRDLTQTQLAPVTAQWVAAAYTPAENRRAEQKDILGLSDTLVAELEAADEYVIGVPMHNFGIPSVAKLWIDLIARAGKTFTYTAGRPRGLLKGKKATFIVASSGRYVYDAGNTLASINFTEPYLRSVFALLGVTQTTFIKVGGTAVLGAGANDRAALLQPYIEAEASQVL